jgi:predicted kinase
MKKVKIIVKRVCNFVRLKLEDLIQKIDKYQNERFHDLAPTDELDASKEYFKALDWALRNDKITNIALSGPYGSGKSSIIQSYMKNYRRLKAINISLATFVELEEFDEEQNEAKKPYVQEKLIDVGEKRIEEGVLKQLFYKVDHKKIPRSRYRKLYRVSKLKIFLKTILALAFIAFGIFYFMPETWNKTVEYIYLFGKYYSLSKLRSWLVVLFFGLIVIWCFSNLLWILLTSYKVKEVNLADKAAITKQDENNESIFDKNMDEIIYFFEETRYKVVFIEDLDRFKSPEIFVRLRELNTILNNYEKIRRKIVFVYAIRDDMFMDKDRTKFFDFIIPIVPIINSTNSNEKLLELLGENISIDDSVDNKPELFTAV